MRLSSSSSRLLKMTYWEPQPERRGKMAAEVRAAGLGPIGVGGAESGR